MGRVAARSGLDPVINLQSFCAARGGSVWRVGVTPSDACGLDQASSSAKRWVLAMLARKGGLCVAPVPRKGAPFSLAA